VAELMNTWTEVFNLPTLIKTTINCASATLMTSSFLANL